MRDKNLRVMVAGRVALAVLLVSSALPPPVRGQSACVPPPSGLVSWWPLDEPSGAIATDVISGQNGTLVATTAVVPGMVGLARRITPAEYMVADGSGALDLSGNQITIDAWIKLENNPTTIQTFTGIVGKVSFQPYLMVFESGSHLRLPQDRWLFEYVFTNAAGVRVHNQATGVVLTVDGQYHHVALTYDGALVSLYVDGARQAGFAFSGNLKSVPTDPVVIAAHQQSSFSIDEVEVYNRSLSATEIQAIFAAGSAGKCKPTPATRIQDLIAQTVALNLKQGISNSLDAKLETALQALDDMKDGNNIAAINALQAFINSVEAQRGIHISDADADSLIAAAQAILAQLTIP